MISVGWPLVLRFAEHNAEFAGGPALAGRTWPDLRARWFDAEFQVDYFLESIRGKRFYGETFPVFWPNLGPNVYAAFHGAELDFGEVTSWIRHCVHERADLERLQFSRDNSYFLKIEELTRVALQKCAGQFMVGYTDLHGSLDCAADWRKGMLRHLDRILAISEIQAIQWVHGVGDDAPIMQWLPVIKKIQAAGKGVFVDLQLPELEPFIAATDPSRLYLCIAAPGSLQPDILKRLEKW